MNILCTIFQQASQAVVATEGQEACSNGSQSSKSSEEDTLVSGTNNPMTEAQKISRRHSHIRVLDFDDSPGSKG